MALQFRRGTASERTSSTDIPAAGEPWFTYDDGKLYIGDGATPGGLEIGASSNSISTDTIDGAVSNISTYAISSNIATIALNVNHTYYTGLEIEISDSPVSILNGTFIIAEIVGANSFRVALTAENITTTNTTGLITPKVKDGASLVYDAVDGVWRDQYLTYGLTDLSDVSIASPVEGQSLVYSVSQSKFTNSNQALASASDVDSSYLTPATYQNPSIGKSLRLDYDLSWKAIGISEEIKDSDTTDFFGIDFTGQDGEGAYTPNANMFSVEDSALSVVDLTYSDFLPYGKGIYFGDQSYTWTKSMPSSPTNLTLDFWLYRRNTSSNLTIRPIDLQGDYLIGSTAVIGSILRVDVTPTYVRIYSRSPQSGNELDAFTETLVRYWNLTTHDTLNPQWVHFRICRSGTTWRLWLDGVSWGSGVAGSGATSGWIFRADLAKRLRIGDPYDSAITTHDRTGPIYIDFRQAISSIGASYIDVPTSRVGEKLYVKGAGLTLDSLDDVGVSSPEVNDGLKWDGSAWVNSPASAAILNTSFKYLNNAPTSIVPDSWSLGVGAGTWYELTAANSSALYSAPAVSEYNPTLTGILFDSDAGSFYNFPRGRYFITCRLIITVDNHIPFAGAGGQSYWGLWVPSLTAERSYSEFPSMTLLPYASYGSSPHTFNLLLTLKANMESSIIANNRLEILLDAEQSPSHYVKGAALDIIKLGDI